ncbi:MAG: CapA family protein, partial [Actinobacteria bacterium]|nr:CapA family protein [Actinomycetota bacterium]
MQRSIKFCVAIFVLGSCTSGSPSLVNSDSISTTIETVVPSTAVTTSTTATNTLESDLSFTIAVSGDTLPHSPLWRGAQRNAAANGDTTGYDFRPMFALVKPILSSVDLAICHLETPIAPADEELSTYPFFGVPIEITDALADAGYDRCSTASNHAMDRGTRGIDTTLDALDRVGISHTGMARTPIEIEPNVFEVNGIKVAHMS